MSQTHVRKEERKIQMWFRKFVGLCECVCTLAHMCERLRVFLISLTLVSAGAPVVWSCPTSRAPSHPSTGAATVVDHGDVDLLEMTPKPTQSTSKSKDTFGSDLSNGSNWLHLLLVWKLQSHISYIGRHPALFRLRRAKIWNHASDGIHLKWNQAWWI